MRALIVYESMFGNTRQIAEAIRDGLAPEVDVLVVGVAGAPTSFDDFDLLVVGGPTHSRGMSWPSTRRSTPLRVAKPESGLLVEPGANSGPGVREWLESMGDAHGMAAAFDTRIGGRLLFTGRASQGITRRLAGHGLSVVCPPESFLVDKASHLLPGELERARTWGTNLTSLVDRARTGGG